MVAKGVRRVTQGEASEEQREARTIGGTRAWKKSTGPVCVVRCNQGGPGLREDAGRPRGGTKGPSLTFGYILRGEPGVAHRPDSTSFTNRRHDCRKAGA